MKDQHTQGEWSIEKIHGTEKEEPGSLVYCKINSNNKTLGFAGVYGMTNKKLNEKEVIANAKLIAAAPEILKALQELRSDLFYQLESKFGAEKASKYPSIIKCDEAIKKAKL